MGLGLIVVCSFLLIGCPSARVVTQPDPGKAPCLNDKQSSLTITWGDIADFSLGNWAGYTLKANTAVSRVAGSATEEASEQTVLLDYVGHETYCETVERVNAYFLKVQALHSPGTKARFIQYANPTTGVYLRAVWNPELETFQSRDMRALFDELSKLVPPDDE